MAVNKLEREFFRKLNALVEPAVRRGLGSPRIAPAGLIVLESVGFKTGQPRRTPLAAMRLGSYVFVSTVRGERSFWVKNLQKQPRVRYFRGGREHEARAFVLAPGKKYKRPKSLPPLIGALTDAFAGHAPAGWALAVLMPAK
ncbi:MAG: nitroreductase family deazaflavin-dependent oxidoreductase [Gammaproteobacteria bacterium]|nr:nitroreductase family deazaflavin-dependent oxidoreductase [Gammaproteobacteria bacterium]